MFRKRSLISDHGVLLLHSNLPLFNGFLLASNLDSLLLLSLALRQKARMGWGSAFYDAHVQKRTRCLLFTRSRRISCVAFTALHFFYHTFLHVLLLACHTALRFFPSLRVLDLLVRVVIAGFTIMLLEQTLFFTLRCSSKALPKV